jgi:hypothetical protein
MHAEHNLWRTARWPLLVIVIAGLGVLTATVLDQAFRSEWSLTIGAPSLGILLPLGVIWLVATIVGNFTRRR